MSRILLIDDDQSFRRALGIVFEKAGYEVIEAGDGREGLAAFKKQPVNLVITDLIMPEMEGMETIQALRKLNPKLLIIAISGGGRGSSEDYLHLARQIGAAKVFAKPFDLGTLCAAVAALLEKNGIATPPSPTGTAALRNPDRTG